MESWNTFIQNENLIGTVPSNFCSLLFYRKKWCLRTITLLNDQLKLFLFILITFRNHAAFLDLHFLIAWNLGSNRMVSIIFIIHGGILEVCFWNALIRRSFKEILSQLLFICRTDFCQLRFLSDTSEILGGSRLKLWSW